MTPQVIANQMVSEFLNTGTRISKKIAKKCANLAVDRILTIMNEEYFAGSHKITFWEEVKNNIDNAEIISKTVYSAYPIINEDNNLDYDTFEKYQEVLAEMVEFSNKNQTIYTPHSNYSWVCVADLTKHFPDYTFADDPHNAFIYVYKDNLGIGILDEYINENDENK